MTLAIPRFHFGSLIQNNLAATPSLGGGTTITGGSANTKGAFSSGQLISSTTFDTHLITVMWANTQTAATATHQLMDIGIGASGSESVLISNLQTGYAFQNSLTMPLFIPKSSRLSARVQGAIASDTVDVTVFCYQAPSSLTWPLFTRCDSYGATTGDSGGLALTPGTSGAESAWTNIGSTTSQKYGAFFPMIQGNPADTTLLNMGLHVEIGISSTTYGEWYFRSFTDESISGPYPPFPFFREIASGSQLQVRAEASGTPESYEFVVYCLG